ncbi:MAG: PAS domain S-box protein [Bacteroidales bacterium]
MRFLRNIWRSVLHFFQSRQVTSGNHEDDKLLDEFLLSWKTLTDNLKSIVFIFNKKGRFIYVNPFMERLTGYSADELKNKYFYEIVHPQYQDLVKKRGYSRLRGEKLPSNYELKIQTKRGDYKWLEISASLVKIHGEKFGFGTGLDITDRKLTENQLKVERAYLENLFHSSPEAIVVTTNEGVVKSVNKEFLSLFGYREDEITGQLLDKYIAPDNGYSEAKEKTDTVARGYRISTEAVRRKKDGTLINVSILGAPIQVDEKQIAVYGIYRNITQRIKNQKELKKAKQKAEEADRIKSAFLANMSHEIRTPMNAILGFARLLKEPSLNKEQLHEYVDIINGRANHLLQIINDILDLSKIESDQLLISEEEFNLNQFLNEIYTVISNELKQAGNSDLDLYLRNGLKEDDANIISDKTRLQQILFNLSNNAVKYTREGFVEFGYRMQNGKWGDLEFFVRDTGIGIEQDKQNVIFDRFRQSDESKTREFGGAGLGLSISKGLADKLGGQMWVNSEYGNGSVFYFTIPFKYKHEKDKIVTLQNNNFSMSYNWENIQILVVEDDMLSSKFLEAILEDTGASIVFTKDGNDALEEVKKNKVDIVLMDIQLPGMSGNETTRQIKEINMNIPVVAQTAHAMSEDKSKSMDAGCDDYLTKPIDMQVLLDKMDALLKKYEKITT